MKAINLHLGGEGHMKPCRDHTGREFPSITAMAAACGNRPEETASGVES